MSILITAATQLEIQPFLNQFPESDYLITGVGAIPTLFHLCEKINNKNYELIVQVGVAGAFSKKLSLGKAYFVKKDCFADLGVIENNELKTVFEMGLANSNKSPFDEGWLINNNSLVENSGVTAITVNLISDDSSHNEMLQRKYNAEIETMEGAVLHYIALQKNIPFIQIRGISNQVGERNKSQWKMKEAIDSSNQLLIRKYHDFISKNSK